jgi:hypothetical protein
MKEYFKPTTTKILGVIILMVIFSLFGVIPYMSDPLKFLTGEAKILFGFPLVYATLTGAVINNVNILNMLIDIIIFYFAICFLSIIFRSKKKEESAIPQVNQSQEGRKEENVPNSNSPGGNTSSPNETQPQY